MKHIVAILSAVFIIALGTIAQAQSLADMAKKEKQRREEVNKIPEKITNEDMAGFSGGSVSAIPEISAQSAEKDSEKKKEDGTAEEGDKAESKDAEKDSDESVDLKGRSESFWRESTAEAQKKIEDLENEAKVLTLKMNDLENQFYNIDDGFDRDKVQREIQKTYYLQDLNKENLAKAREEQKELETDARQSGALPGWVE